jgi:hypothetical protein
MISSFKFKLIKTLSYLDLDLGFFKIKRTIALKNATAS